MTIFDTVTHPCIAKVGCCWLRKWLHTAYGTPKYYHQILIDTWFSDSNRRVGVWSLPWRWHILSIPLTSGRGTGAETSGLDDVFPPDDLCSRPEALCQYIYIYISSRMFCPWTFCQNIGFNMVPSDPFMSHLATQLRYSAREFWKSIFKQQLGCRFDIMDSISSFFLWSSKSFTSPQPANHLFIKINLLRNTCQKCIHACCSLCR